MQQSGFRERSLALPKCRSGCIRPNKLPRVVLFVARDEVPQRKLDVSRVRNKPFVAVQKRQEPPQILHRRWFRKIAYSFHAIRKRQNSFTTDGVTEKFDFFSGKLTFSHVNDQSVVP